MDKMNLDSINIVDNDRCSLAEVLVELSAKHNKLSIATGYFDLAGWKVLIDHIKNYQTIRLLIGREVSLPRYGLDKIEENFPQFDITQSLSQLPTGEGYRRLIQSIHQLRQNGQLEVRTYKKSFLHAKCYVFGDYDDEGSKGIVGSSNFTGAGLNNNRELNVLERDHRVVVYNPTNSKNLGHGHLSWFDQVWAESEEYSGEFIDILRSSKLGDLTYSPYDMYIKTLYELYEDLVVGQHELQIGADLKKMLYEFQYRNAELILNKLEKHGFAMLSDSVGLGKTITAGAIIKHYKDGLRCRRIYVIAPSGLCWQWGKELADKYQGMQVEVISMHDIQKIKRKRSMDKHGNVDLFVIDEAHNLRNPNSKRSETILGWLRSNPDSKVLLVTATPVNNSLTDFSHQIQLANKGHLELFQVAYKTKNKLVVDDYYTAINNLSNEIKRLTSRKKKSKSNQQEYNRLMIQANEVMSYGLNRYLVRSTRQGVKDKGQLKKDGQLYQFPQDINKKVVYETDTGLLRKVTQLITENIAIWGGYDLNQISSEDLIEETIRSQHPLDLLAGKTKTISQESLLFETVSKLILLLGFSNYRFRIYHRYIYAKSYQEISESIDKITSKRQIRQIRSHLSFHALLKISFLKILESSAYALRQSLKRYRQKIIEFEDNLTNGIFVFRQYTADDLDDFVEDDQRPTSSRSSKKDYVEEEVDTSLYNIEALKRDLQRDKDIIAVIIKICQLVENQDSKLEGLAGIINENRGKKLLVFSYYSETIKYLQQNLNKWVDKEINFASRADFVDSKNRNKVNDLVDRFAPVANDARQKVSKGQEIDYLFATDVLSEGKNLQDCQTIVHFDLHWNPVRMIQRNGRINRLGSEHSEVYVYNICPQKELNRHLQLIQTLERKIDSIRYTIGTDQSVLGEEANPIEWIESQETDKKHQFQAQMFDKIYRDGEQTSDNFTNNDSLMSVDQHIDRLNDFINKASEADKDRVKSIPMGKWGYLPKQNLIPPETDILVLSRVIRSEQLKTGQIIKKPSMVFVRINATNDNYSTDLTTTMDALNQIATTPQDTQRQPDTVKYDRSKASKNALDQAKIGQTTGKPLIGFKKSDIQVLDELSQHPQLFSVGDVLSSIDNTADKKQLKRLFKKAKTQQREAGSISAAVIDEFRSLVDKLRSKLDEQVGDEIDVKSRGVLFYVRQ